MLIFHYYLCKFIAVLQYSVIVFKNDLCVCDNILMYHIKSLGSSSKQPKIDTCAQPDCVNQQDWQQCQVAVCVHVFPLTRVWALASPASALSFNCSTDKSSSASSSGGEGDAFNVHTSISIDNMLASKLAEQYNFMEGTVWLCWFLHTVFTASDEQIPPDISCNMRITRSQRWRRCESVCILNPAVYLSVYADTLWQDPPSTPCPAPMSPQYLLIA